MKISVIDHKFSPWVLNKRQENGASTYSRDINDILMPDLIRELSCGFPDQQVLISTAPPLAKYADHLDDKYQHLIIQFLHSYPYQDSFLPIMQLIEKFPSSKIIFVTAYYAYKIRIESMIWEKDLEDTVAVHYLPMFINTHLLEDKRLAHSCRLTDDRKRIIYFGNLYKAKAPEYHRLKAGLAKMDWKLDVISKSRLNGSGKLLDQRSTWDIISGYDYGIGVGRCALEMYHIGLKVLISGEHWGGICLGLDDYLTQQRTNFNGRIITGTRDLHEALEILPMTYQPDMVTPKKPATESGLVELVKRMCF